MTNTDTTSTSENVNGTDSKHLISREVIIGTPFEKIETEKGTFIAWGAHRLTEIAEYGSEADEIMEDRVKMAENMDWDLIGAFVSAIVTGVINHLKEQENGN